MKEAAETREPVDLSKVTDYRPTSKQEYDDAINTYTTTECPFLADATKDPLASIKDLLSKKPQKIQPPSPSKKTPSNLIAQLDFLHLRMSEDCHVGRYLAPKVVCTLEQFHLMLLKVVAF